MRNDPLTDDRLIREVEQFLYREARLLDSRRFREWLELFTEDVRYWMINRANRYPRHSKAIAILDPARYVESDLAEFILQLADEQPSHFLAPALHYSRERITALFKRKFKTDLPERILASLPTPNSTLGYPDPRSFSAFKGQLGANGDGRRRHHRHQP